MDRNNLCACHQRCWVANGWTSTVEHTYHVQISGVAPAIEYDVQMVACP